VSLIVDAKNALSLLCRGEWREFIFRVRVYRGEIDLRNATTDDLGLPAERTHEYSNSGGLHLEKVLRALKITREDAIVDFGSGKGGALITFAKYPFSKITGVELSPELVATAKINLKKLDIDNVDMIISDAADFTDLDGYDYFYFFNPFPAAVMSTVIKNIASSLARRPRKLTIIYFNPEHHESVVTDSPFVKIQEFHHHDLSYYIYSNAA
jgi:SAM-dependent methyltransferase